MTFPRTLGLWSRSGENRAATGGVRLCGRIRTRRGTEILASLRINLANVAALDVLSDAAAVSQAKTAQQEAAGDVAESELAKEFAVYGNWQDRTGYIWLAAAVVLFAATVAIATIVLKQVDQAFNWYSLAAHLLIALPCLGLGAYCARESSRHRELAQWARRLAVQLKSVGAYTARLDDAARLALLAQFGSYVFGPHPLGKDDNLKTLLRRCRVLRPRAGWATRLLGHAKPLSETHRTVIARTLTAGR